MWARNGTCGGPRQKSADSLYCGRPHRGHGHGGGEPKSVTNDPEATSFAKHRDRPYRSGRSPDWIKVKNPDAPATIRVIDFGG
jgi:hypothetical protein